MHNIPLYVVDKLNVAAQRLDKEKFQKRRMRLSPTGKLVQDLLIEPTIGLIQRHPEGWQRLYASMVLDPDYRLIGGGMESTVLRRGNMVTKVDRESLLMRRHEQRQRLRERSQLFKAAKAYLGEHLLPQSVTLGLAPFRSKPLAVLTKQVWVSPIVPDLVHQDVALTRAQLNAAHIPEGSVAEEIANFLKGSEQLLCREGLYPDFGGPENIAVVKDSRTGSPQLVLIDSYVTSPESRSIPSTNPGFETVGQEHEADVLRLQGICEALLDPSELHIMA